MSTGYIDTEFNGFGGELISMAIVIETGVEFYEVKQIPEHLDFWVAENVIPVLGKPAVGPAVFTARLHKFLRENMPSLIVADWPSDLEHLFREMMGAKHSETLQLYTLARCDPFTEYVSDTPHNALQDARALMKAHSSTTPERTP